MKKQNNGQTWGILFLTALVLVTGNSCKRRSADGLPLNQNAEPAGDIIRVGEVGSLTGSEASFGAATHQGIELAIQEINSKGGIKNKKIELVTADDQSKPDEAATAVTKLVTQNRVSAILGEVASSRSMAMAAIAQDFKIPMITPSSTNPKVTELGDYIFRVCFIDPFQGQVMAKFALNDLKFTRIAILRDIKSDYSTGLSQYFIEAFKKGGGTIVKDESYTSGDIDFKSQLTAIRTANAQGIFAPGYYTEIGLIARQAKELKLSTPLLGGDGWDSPKLTEIAGSAIDGSYFSNHYTNENKDPMVQSFITKYKETYHMMPDGISTLGYDAAMVLFDAMKRAKTLSSADIRDALANTQNFPGVAGKISIDSKRNAIKSAVVLKIENGNFKYQTTVNP